MQAGCGLSKGSGFIYALTRYEIRKVESPFTVKQNSLFVRRVLDTVELFVHEGFTKATLSIIARHLQSLVRNGLQLAKAGHSTPLPSCALQFSRIVHCNLLVRVRSCSVIPFRMSHVDLFCVLCARHPLPRNEPCQGYCPDGTACKLKHELPERKRVREAASTGDQGVSVSLTAALLIISTSASCPIHVLRGNHFRAYALLLLIVAPICPFFRSSSTQDAFGRTCCAVFHSCAAFCPLRRSHRMLMKCRCLRS